MGRALPHQTSLYTLGPGWEQGGGEWGRCLGGGKCEGGVLDLPFGRGTCGEGGK